MALLLALDLVLAAVAVVAWRTQPVERRGSKPPSGQRIPDLRGELPGFPAPAQMRGGALALAVTCVDCRSGDVFGGFLARLAGEPLPDDSQLRVVGLGGDVEAWREEWSLPAELKVHHAAGASRSKAVRQALRMGDSGVLYVYDRDGRWVSTFHAGQLQREDVLADLEAAGAGRLGP